MNYINKFNDENMISNCCGAPPMYNNIDNKRCSDCKENCDFLNYELKTPIIAGVDFTESLAQLNNL